MNPALWLILLMIFLMEWTIKYGLDCQLVEPGRIEYILQTFVIMFVF